MLEIVDADWYLHEMMLQMGFACWLYHFCLFFWGCGPETGFWVFIQSMEGIADPPFLHSQTFSLALFSSEAFALLIHCEWKKRLNNLELFLSYR